jgi:DNA-binding IclR family transcriptional regulator
MHCCAPGKAFLAAMSKAELAGALPRRLPALTPNTITSRKELWEVLDRVRADGVAYDREEHTLGICAVGAVVRDPYRALAAISVPVPAQRFAGNEAELAGALVEVCGECSRQLGDLSETPEPGGKSA